MRNGFDYTAECGVWHCRDCAHEFYPMELEDNGTCPLCLGICVRMSDFECKREAWWQLRGE